jgi:6-phosphogluconate dehydrogenase
MKLAMIGLGKMGANMTRRLLQAGHEVIVFDLDPAEVEQAITYGAQPAGSLQDLAILLPQPRVVWMMVPAGNPVEKTIQVLNGVLSAGDMIVDGGNSNYKDTQRRGDFLAEKGISLVDCGTSGGIWGLKDGYSLMVGGDQQAVEYLRPVLEALAPAPDRGWGHVGPRGAGHYVKMVHNGIEYGLMEAYAEGFQILDAKHEFNLDMHQVAQTWRYGSVIRSWLLELITDTLATNPALEGIKPWVADSGEGRWTVFEAVDLDVPAPVITLALQTRLFSRQQESYAAKLLAAMRHSFGGHPFQPG